MTDMVSKVDRVSATEISELIDSMRHRPVATTAAQMRLAADALEITERAYQGVLTDNRDLATEIERLTKWQNEAAQTQQAQCVLICRQEDEVGRLRAALAQISSAGEIHDPLWAGVIARAALAGSPVETTAPRSFGWLCECGIFNHVENLPCECGRSKPAGAREV